MKLILCLTREQHCGVGNPTPPLFPFKEGGGIQQWKRGKRLGESHRMIMMTFESC